MKDFTQILNENIRHEEKYGGMHHRIAWPLKLSDGTIMSVQASETHYCEPIGTVDYTLYGSFEIGFPSRVISKLLPYAEDKEKPTDTVYAAVPKKVILEVIEDCGGLSGVDKRR